MNWMKLKSNTKTKSIMIKLSFLRIWIIKIIQIKKLEINKYINQYYYMEQKGFKSEISSWK